MKALTVDFELIEQAMRDLCRETADYFLDRISGKVMAVSRELMCALANENLEERKDVPQWDAQMIPVAREIVLQGSRQYTRIPEAYGRPEHAWMIVFTDDLKPEELKQRMHLALRGRGSCQRFKQILQEFPDDLRRWTMFRAHCWENKIQAWLESIGIIAFDTNPNRSRASIK